MAKERRELRIWLALLDKYEAQLRLKYAGARNAFVRGTASAYIKNPGTAPAYMLLSFRNSLQATLESHYRIVVPKFGDLALRGIKSQHVEVKSLKNAYLTFLDEWILTQTLRKATTISETDMDEVRRVIELGLDEGEGVEAIARRIRGITKQTPDRAAMIARTETHSAATFGSIESVRQAEDELDIKMLKEWLPTIDARTRSSHIAMDNKPPIPLDEKFLVGGERLDRPGDPSGSPSNIINCRCGLAYTEAED